MNRNNTPHETPLDADTIKHLIPSHISSRAELERWEQDNINEALAWIDKRVPKNILTEQFMKQLHKKMFCHVWRWAGKMRQKDAQLGVPHSRISLELEKLCVDINFWIAHKTYSPDEIATRFHHRLVFIRPFINGNGRHARLITDILLENKLNRPAFTWGQAHLADQGLDRTTYIQSLVAANKKDYQSLVEFVRS